MLPDPSVAPKDRPDGAATGPVPLCGTAAKANHQFFTVCIITQLQKTTQRLSKISYGNCKTHVS